jgi:predicted nuclease of restriction endonuclease-like RecB superfamily
VLTADLVTVRRRGEDLRLVPLDDDDRARAAALAADYLAAARAHVGRSRQELEAAWQAVPVAAREQRLAAGVRKLVSDRCLFATDGAVDSVALRAELFHAAASVRRGLAPGVDFDRAAVIAAVAARRTVSPEVIDASLYADLHGAERLDAVQPLDPAALAARFDLAQAQGVLLRAVRVAAEVRASEAARYRALFGKLKFLRLLHTITPAGKDGYRIEIDGPFSLFQSVTRYGLQLGLALPSIVECDRWQLEADVLWGRERKPLRFRWSGQTTGATPPDGAPTGSATGALPDEVAGLLAGVNALDGPWQATPSTEIFSLPGVGLCVPDLEFRNAASGARAFLEVMGFWSRQAVWRRIDLVRGGLPQPIVFAISKQLRVSEEALDQELPSALYVYARAMNARAVVARIAAVAR